VLEWPSAATQEPFLRSRNLTQESFLRSVVYPTPGGGHLGSEVGAPGFDQALKDYIERHNDTQRSHPVADFQLTDASSFAAYHIVPREYFGILDLEDVPENSWPDFVKLLNEVSGCVQERIYYDPCVNICDFDLLPAGDAPAIPLRMCYWGASSDFNTGSAAYVCNRKTGQQAFKVTTHNCNF
jgi:hypothetical protein